jgi:hypothetical protein
MFAKVLFIFLFAGITFGQLLNEIQASNDLTEAKEKQKGDALIPVATDLLPSAS